MTTQANPDQSTRIITNNQSRLLLSWEELTDKERAGHDYFTAEDIANGDTGDFFRYRGYCYSIAGSFTTTADYHGTPIAEWDGVMADTFFSAIVVKYAKDGDVTDYDRVIVGLALS
jgi:hypothetical protein